MDLKPVASFNKFKVVLNRVEFADDVDAFLHSVSTGSLFIEYFSKLHNRLRDGYSGRHVWELEDEIMNLKKNVQRPWSCL